jgi:hypothetical protein
MSVRFASLLAFSCLLALPSRAAAEPLAASNRLRTSLVWLFGDDDVLHAPGDTSPPSPSAGIGDRSGYEPLAAGRFGHYTGRENLSELTLEGTAPGLVRSLSTRALLALDLDLSSLGTRGAPIALNDAGSFVELSWTFGHAGSARPDALTLRAFPLNGDRERVGALELLGWGGAVGPRWESPYTASEGGVRAVRLELGLGFALAHVGLKTATFLEQAAAGPAVAETSYGYFAGVTSRFRGPVGVAIGVGHFEHGRLPGGADAPRATTTGASLALHAGFGISQPLPPESLGLERSPFEPGAHGPDASTAERRGVAFGAEAAHVVQRLWDFDHPGGSALAPGRAVAVFGELALGPVDTRVLASLRDAGFVMRNGPGAFPSETLPRAAATQSELGLFASVAVALGPMLRPSLGASVIWPAAVRTNAIDRFGQATGATLVLRGPGDIESLPPGTTPVPVLEARPGLELRLSTLLELFAWLQYRRDLNRTRLEAAPGGALARGFQGPDRLGYGVAARAVW